MVIPVAQDRPQQGCPDGRRDLPHPLALDLGGLHIRQSDFERSSVLGRHASVPATCGTSRLAAAACSEPAGVPSQSRWPSVQMGWFTCIAPLRLSLMPGWRRSLTVPPDHPESRAAPAFDLGFAPARTGLRRVPPRSARRGPRGRRAPLWSGTQPGAQASEFPQSMPRPQKQVVAACSTSQPGFSLSRSTTRATRRVSLFGDHLWRVDRPTAQFVRSHERGDSPCGEGTNGLAESPGGDVACE